jgi:amino acid adenylation domain-containing protein
LERLGEQQANQEFDLSRPPLLRAHLLQAAPAQHYLLLTLHHIITDGWSMQVLVGDLVRLYNAFRQGQPNPLAPLPIHYKDYTLWQLDQLQGETSGKLKSYWQEQFQGELPLLELPADFARRPVRRQQGATLQAQLPPALQQALQQLAHRQQVSLFMVLLASVKALLYRYSGQEDIIIGSPIAGREHPDLEEQVGFFVNMLALRTRFSGEDSFMELLEKVRKTTLGAYAHQSYPFDELVEGLNLQRDLSRSPLFEVMLVLHNEAKAAPALDHLRVETQPVVSTSSKFALTFSFGESEQGLDLLLEYDTDLFTQQRMERLMHHLPRLLEELSQHPHLPLSRLDYLSLAEKGQLEGFNGSACHFEQAPLQVLFERQAALTPDAVALAFQHRQLTYRELNEQANQLAHYLRDRYQLEPQQVVGLLLERSHWLIVSLLGVLKAGGAYLPIDVDYPSSRQAYMLEDARPRLLLTSGSGSSGPATDSSTTEQQPSWPCPWEDIEELSHKLSEYPTHNPLLLNQGHHLAYLMYTSGSTGRPKGVMIEHKSVANLVQGAHYVHPAAGDVLLATGSPSFDATTFEYWSMLLTGGQLVMAGRSQLLDSRWLGQQIVSTHTNKMWFTAGWFNQLVDTEMWLFAPLSVVLTGGERLSAEHVERFKRAYPHIVLINCYGPTENTAYSACYRFPAENDAVVLIGKPIANTQVYVLDGQDQLLPVGVVGEICLSGAGLARGYLNQPELTAEKFVDNPFRPGEKMYRTGDLGRWLEEGNLEYVGRRDDQVKLRGFQNRVGGDRAAVAGLSLRRSSRGAGPRAGAGRQATGGLPQDQSPARARHRRTRRRPAEFGAGTAGALEPAVALLHGAFGLPGGGAPAAYGQRQSRQESPRPTASAPAGQRPLPAPGR